MIAIDSSVGIVGAVVAAMAGTALLLGRRRIAARLWPKPEDMVDGEDLAGRTIFFVGLCLVLLGSGAALLLATRAFGAITPSG